MIEVGINEGDIAIIKQKSNANDGDLVAALIDDTETTLKRFKRSGPKIILKAEIKIINLKYMNWIKYKNTGYFIWPNKKI